ncbi:MAG: VRR-NUC domain-containing protein [Chloroflexota bacterium]
MFIYTPNFIPAIPEKTGQAVTPEARILADIRLALGKEPGVVAWRISQGLGYTPDGRVMRAGSVPGMADLIAVVAPHGRWLGLEIKAPRGRLSDEQRLWGALLEKHGGIYAVVRSVPDAIAALTRAREKIS